MEPQSQFLSAFRALTKENTGEFNKRYATEAISPPPSRPSSPMAIAESKRSNSQFELAKLALQEQSPAKFNVRYGVSRRRKLRKQRKASRTRRRK